MAKKITITKDRTRKDDIKDSSRCHEYSGQKIAKNGIFRKKETIKTEIVIEENGKILSVSKSHRGRTLE